MSIFLKQSKYKNGKTYLSLVNGYYDRNTKNTKQITIEKIGFLDDLKIQYDDPISTFTAKASKLNHERQLSKIIDAKINLEEDITINNDSLNIGYIFLKYIYNELGLNDFFKDKQSKLDIQFNLNKIFSLLVYSRILYPSSKKQTFEGKNKFFEPFNDFELHDVYRSLDYFNTYKEDIEKLLWKKTKDSYHRDTSNCYYDCTNYYFEINYNDEDLVDEEGNIIEKGYRKRGPEKNHRPDPIVEMGLLMDATDLPISYDLFPGNESEKLSLLPITRRMKKNCNLDRVVIVADRGLNTSDNIFYLSGRNDKNLDGYIYGQSVRGADKEFKDWILNQKDYICTPITNEDGTPKLFRQMKFDENGNLIGYEKKQEYFKHKSRIYPKEITIKKDGKRNTKVRTDQKQMVYFSQKYADKQKHDRNQMIERAKDIIANPKKYDRITAKGAKSYINNIAFNKNTGEVVDGRDLSLKLDKIKEEELYDGYYSIVTSELEMNDEELHKKYRGLSKIEETFKITKSELEARPTYVWTNDHIESHFLTCFVALYIIRLLENKTNKEISIGKLINSIKNFQALNTSENIYRIFGANETIITLLDIFNITELKKNMTREKFRKILKY